MRGKFSLCEVLIGVLVIVFSLLTIPDVSQWVLSALGALLIVHSFICRKCRNCVCDAEESPKAGKKKRK